MTTCVRYWLKTWELALTESEVVQSLLKLIDKALVGSDLEPVEGDLYDDDFLPDILDSVALMTLVGLIEEKWDLEITDDEIGLEMFEDLASLASFVERKRRDAGSIARKS